MASPHTARVKIEAGEAEQQTPASAASSRPFDVSSLIKKEAEAPGVNNNLVCGDLKSSPVSSPCPPASAASLYPYLGLYSQLLTSPVVHMPGLMMGAQLALASAHHQNMLASAWAGLQAPASAPLMSDRLKASRFSPYSHFPPTKSPPASSDKSAFQTVLPAPKVAPGSPPPSPSSHTATTSLRIKTITPPSLSPANSHTSSTSPGDSAAASAPSSEIRRIQRMVTGLDGGLETKYGISHSSPETDPKNAMKKSQ